MFNPILSLVPSKRVVPRPAGQMHCFALVDVVYHDTQLFGRRVGGSFDALTNLGAVLLVYQGMGCQQWCAILRINIASAKGTGCWRPWCVWAACPCKIHLKKKSGQKEVLVESFITLLFAHSNFKEAGCMLICMDIVWSSFAWLYWLFLGLATGCAGFWEPRQSWAKPPRPGCWF